MFRFQEAASDVTTQPLRPGDPGWKDDRLFSSIYQLAYHPSLGSTAHVHMDILDWRASQSGLLESSTGEATEESH